MRYFDDNRRRVTKEKAIKGVKRTVSSETNTIALEKSSGTIPKSIALFGNESFARRVNFFNKELLAYPTQGSVALQTANGYTALVVSAGTLYTGQLVENLKQGLKNTSAIVLLNGSYSITGSVRFSFVDENMNTLFTLMSYNALTTNSLSETKREQLKQAYGILFTYAIAIGELLIGTVEDLNAGLITHYMPYEAKALVPNDIILKAEGYNLLDEKKLLERGERGSKITLLSSGEYSFDSYPCSAHSDESSGIAFLEEFKRCVKADKTYTIVGTFSSVGPGEAGYFYLKSAPSGGDTIFSFKNNYNVSKVALKTFTLTQEQLDATNNIWIYGTSQANLNNGAKPTVGNFMILEGEYTLDALPKYEPYAPSQELIIPNEITLDDGTIVPLRFGKIGDYKDCLLVDFEKSTVIYETQIKTKEITNGLAWAINTWAKNAYGENYYQAYVGTVVNNLGFSNYYPLNKWATRNNNVFFAVSNHLIFRTDGVMSIADWRNELYMLKNYSGAEIKATYVSKSVATYDLTNTELGQNLLNLKLPKNTVIVSAKGELGADAHIKAEYYTTDIENGDMQELTITCVDEQENVLDAKYHLVRQDSGYKVIAPNIEGYAPIVGELTGVASEDAEIEFVYKEITNVSV